MNQKQMTSFRRRLFKWYRENARALPWRKTKDPYKIWISEVMLQQTTVNAVIPYYKKWIKKYKTIGSVAKESDQRLLKMWQGLGYYQRCKNIKKAAIALVKDHQGKIPKEPSILKTIPGFGPYTVGAVLSIAYDYRIPIIDANVRRVFMRILGIDDYISVKHDDQINTTLEKLLPRKNVSDFNQALMELGALICRNNEPICSTCPVKTCCQSYKRGIQEIIPKRKSKKIKNLNVAIGIIKNRNEFLIQQRSSKGLLASLWEFPGGKIEQGENPHQALKRELKEEVGIAPKTSKFLFHINHFYTQFKVKLFVYYCCIDKRPTLQNNQRWVNLKGLYKYPMPSGSAKIVDRISAFNHK